MSSPLFYDSYEFFNTVLSFENLPSPRILSVPSSPSIIPTISLPQTNASLPTNMVSTPLSEMPSTASQMSPPSPKTSTFKPEAAPVKYLSHPRPVWGSQSPGWAYKFPSADTLPRWTSNPSIPDMISNGKYQVLACPWEELEGFLSHINRSIEALESKIRPEPKYAPYMYKLKAGSEDLYERFDHAFRRSYMQLDRTYKRKSEGTGYVQVYPVSWNSEGKVLEYKDLQLDSCSGTSTVSVDNYPLESLLIKTREAIDAVQREISAARLECGPPVPKRRIIKALQRKGEKFLNLREQVRDALNKQKRMAMEEHGEQSKDPRATSGGFPMHNLDDELTSRGFPMHNLDDELAIAMQINNWHFNVDRTTDFDDQDEEIERKYGPIPSAEQVEARQKLNTANSFVSYEISALRPLKDLCTEWVKFKKPFRYVDLPAEIRIRILEVIARDIIQKDGGIYFINTENDPDRQWRKSSAQELMRVNKETRYEFSKAFFRNITLEFNVPFGRIPAAMLSLGSDSRNLIKHLTLSWVTADINDNDFDLKAAKAICSFEALEGLEIEIDWLRARHKYSPRVDLGHWMAHTSGIQQLVVYCRKLKSVHVSHSAEAENDGRRGTIGEAERISTVDFLQTYLNERLVPTSQEFKDWPGKRHKMVEDIINKTIAISDEEKDHVTRTMQYLGFPRTLVLDTNKITQYHCRGSFAIMLKQVASTELDWSGLTTEQVEEMLTQFEAQPGDVLSVNGTGGFGANSGTSTGTTSFGDIHQAGHQADRA